MSERSRQTKATRNWIAMISIAVLAILLPVGAWRISTSLVVPEPYYPPPLVPTLSREKLEAIAIGEVKRREGWSGKVDEPSREGGYWFFVIRRKPGATKDWRCITLLGASGMVVDYEIRTDLLTPVPTR